MTHEEAIELQPQSRFTYAGMLLLCAAFTWLELFFHPHHPLRDMWARPLLLLMIGLMAAQSASRLLFPVWSAKLTLHLTRSRNFDTTLRALSFCIVALLVVSLVRGPHSELHLLSSTGFLLLFTVADVFGKDSLYQRPKAFSTQAPPLWRESLKPIHSTHWGEH